MLRRQLTPAASLVPPALPALLAPLDQQVQPAPPVPPVHKAPLVLPAPRVPLASQAHRVPPASPARSGSKDRKARKVQPDHPDHKAHKVLLEQVAHPHLMVELEVMVAQEAANLPHPAAATMQHPCLQSSSRGLPAVRSCFTLPSASTKQSAIG